MVPSAAPSVARLTGVLAAQPVDRRARAGDAARHNAPKGRGRQLRPHHRGGRQRDRHRRRGFIGVNVRNDAGLAHQSLGGMAGHFVGRLPVNGDRVSISCFFTRFNTILN